MRALRLYPLGTGRMHRPPLSRPLGEARRSALGLFLVLASVIAMVSFVVGACTAETTTTTSPAATLSITSLGVPAESSTETTAPVATAQIAYVKAGNEIWTVNLDGTGARKVLQIPGKAGVTLWCGSQMGHWLAYSGPDGFSVLNLDTGATTLVTTALHPVYHWALPPFAASNDGKYLCFWETGEHGDNLVAYDVANGDKTTLATDKPPDSTGGPQEGAPVVSPDSRLVAYCEYTQEATGIHVMAIDGSATKFTQLPENPVYNVSGFSADGKNLVAFAQPNEGAVPYYAMAVGSDLSLKDPEPTDGSGFTSPGWLAWLYVNMDQNAAGWPGGNYGNGDHALSTGRNAMVAAYKGQDGYYRVCTYDNATSTWMELAKDIAPLQNAVWVWSFGSSASVVETTSFTTTTASAAPLPTADEAAKAVEAYFNNPAHQDSISDSNGNGMDRGSKLETIWQLRVDSEPYDGTQQQAGVHVVLEYSHDDASWGLGDFDFRIAWNGTAWNIIGMENHPFGYWGDVHSQLSAPFLAMTTQKTSGKTLKDKDVVALLDFAYTTNGTTALDEKFLRWYSHKGETVDLVGKVLGADNYYGGDAPDIAGWSLQMSSHGTVFDSHVVCYMQTTTPPQEGEWVHIHGVLSYHLGEINVDSVEATSENPSGYQ